PDCFIRLFFFSSRRRHTRSKRDWSSDVCSSDLAGIVISHGTDTMAYTASMLTFMLPNLNIPVVLTGSQVPMNVLLSDAPRNLTLAFTAAASCAPGVYLPFDCTVMRGCRTRSEEHTSELQPRFD